MFKKVCRWLDSNRGGRDLNPDPLVSGDSALPATAKPEGLIRLTANLLWPATGALYCDKNRNFSIFLTTHCASHSRFAVSLKVHLQHHLYLPKWGVSLNWADNDNNYLGRPFSQRTYHSGTAPKQTGLNQISSETPLSRIWSENRA